MSRLEYNGWVRREQAKDDRRGQLAILTDDGLARLVEVAPGHAKTVRSIMFDPLSDRQLTQFQDICATVLAQLRTSWKPVQRAGSDLRDCEPRGRGDRRIQASTPGSVRPILGASGMPVETYGGSARASSWMRPVSRPRSHDPAADDVDLECAWRIRTPTC